jgi:lipopolysaccharide/colanic/teichoic acid biosynthesis glycosyltransferase
MPAHSAVPIPRLPTLGGDKVRNGFGVRWLDASGDSDGLHRNYAARAETPGLPGWFNRLAAVLGICALAPLLGLVWLLIRLDSAGPAVFRQPRLGRGGRCFICYKFRTMSSDSGSNSKPLEIQDFDTFVFSPKGERRDLRLTRLGIALRATSVDELPQLLNVLNGEMALIGPRPELPEIVAQYPPAYHERHLVLPGISGFAQVNGRSDLTYGEIAALDLAYVRSRSPLLDLKLLWETVAVVARGAGAR